jgi:hypothetical protein
MTYTPGGKGIAPRQSERPSWIGLEEIGRDALTVTFKTKTGTRTVPLADVEKFNRRKGKSK